MRKYLLHVLIISFVFLLAPAIQVASYADEKRLEDAKEEVRKNPDDEQAHFNLGNAYLNAYKDTLASLRSDYTKKSTTGWIGSHKMTDGSGRVVTDLAAKGILVHKGEFVSYPLLVPTLTQGEINEVLKGKGIPLSVGEKARAHAQKRLEQGLSPYYNKRLTQYMPLGLTEAICLLYTSDAADE